MTFPELVNRNQQLVEVIKGIVTHWKIPKEFTNKPIDKIILGDLLISLGQLLGGKTISTGTTIVSSASIQQIENKVERINNNNWNLENNSPEFLERIARIREEFSLGGLTNTYKLIYELAINLTRLIIETNTAEISFINDLPLENNDLNFPKKRLTEEEVECWENFTEVILQSSLVLSLMVNQCEEIAKEELEKLKTLEANVAPQIEKIIRNPDSYPTLKNHVQRGYRTYSEYFENKPSERIDYRSDDSDNCELHQEIIVKGQLMLNERDWEIKRLKEKLKEKNTYELADYPEDIREAQNFIVKLTEEMQNLREGRGDKETVRMRENLNSAYATIAIVNEQKRGLVEKVRELEADIGELNALVGDNAIKTIREKREKAEEQTRQIFSIKNKVKSVLEKLDRTSPLSEKEYNSLIQLQEEVNKLDYSGCSLYDPDSPESIAKTTLDEQKLILDLLISNWTDPKGGLT